MTPQVTPAPAPQAPKGAQAGAHPPAKGGAPPGLFTALLGAAATAAGPPGHAATPARTAHAEGTPAEGDSSGHTDSHTTLAPMPAAAAAAAPVPQAPPAAAPPAKEATLPPVQPVDGAGAPVGVRRIAEAPAHVGRGASAPAPAEQPLPLPAPVPVVAPPVDRTADGRRIGRVADTPVPVQVPARPHEARPARGRRPADGIGLAAPQVPAARPATAQDGAQARGLRRPGNVPVHHAAPAAPPPAAVTDPAPAHAAGHTRPPAAAAPELPRVRVHELAESMHALVKVANRRGTAAARITLRPAELGGVQVRLRAHAGGVSASLTAQTAAGAQALGAAHGELRRALESQGIAVHTIDVQLAGDGPGPDGRPHEWQPGGDEGSPERPPRDDDDFEPHHTIEPTRLPLADGQVDVLA